MKYLLFIVLLAVVVITAGCVSENKNSVITPTQTTPAPTIIVTTTVPTITQTTTPIDSFVGTWIATNWDGSKEKHKAFANGRVEWGTYDDGTIQEGTWTNLGANRYRIFRTRFGDTLEYIYNENIDAIGTGGGGGGWEYREGKVPSPSSSGQTQSGVTHLSGRADDVQSFTATGSGLRIFTMSHTGTHNFAVVLKDSGGNYITLLVNEIGSYSGKKSERLTSGTYYLDITADGAWTIDISSM